MSGDYLLGVKIDSTNTITLYGYEIKSSSNYSKIMKDNVSSMITVPPKFKYDSVKRSFICWVYGERAKHL